MAGPAEAAASAIDLRDFHRVALALAAEGDTGRLLELIVTKCREVTTADAGSLYIVEPTPVTAAPSSPEVAAAGVLRFAVAQNDSIPLDAERATLPLDRPSLVGHVALTRKLLNLPDVSQLPPDLGCAFDSRIDRAMGYRTVSMLAVPLIDHGDHVIGVLQLINKKRSPLVRLETPAAAEGEAQPFGPRDEEMVTFLASLAAVVAVRGRQADATRRELEHQLRQAQKMEAVGRLAGGIAHDFNNLLTVIIGRSQLLLRRLEAADPLRGTIELIDQAAGRAAMLTQQLLAFSRKQVLNPQVLDLNDVVASSNAILRRVLGEDIDLGITAAPALGRTRADPGQLEQVILNLAVNARDAMPHGGRLTITTGNLDLDDAFARDHPGARPGRYVMLAVQDTGIGMGAEVLGHVFEPFFTTKEPGKGTGLGLATVYGIVKQHEGYITVESRPGRGTTFAIFLPQIKDSAAAPAQAVGPRELPAPCVRPTRAETVLLVEDEAALRELAREVLEIDGYTVLEARHGLDALRVSERHAGPIHLLLTDVVMPEMGGRALADRLEVVRPGIKVLYMSGYTADAIVQHGVLEPDIQFVPKPFTPEALTRRVREVLERQTQARDAGA